MTSRPARRTPPQDQSAETRRPAGRSAGDGQATDRPALSFPRPSGSRPARSAVATEGRPAGGQQRRRRPPRVDRELFGQPSGSQASAGRVLAVGLLCFLIWTLFDANQLYHNALSSPFGTRRTVAVSLLRPIAAVTNAIGLSGPVNTADSALGRDAAGASPTLPTVPLPPGGIGRVANDTGPNGLSPRPHGGGRIILPPKPVWPPPLAQPTVAHPLVMLDIGDSIGEDLGYGLGDVFANDRYVRVLQKGKIDTGLARPDIYNWPAVLDEELKRYHPGAVVIMMGANDNQALSLPDGQAVSVGTKKWATIYRQRITLLMEEATSAGAHVIWVGLPPLSAPSVNSAFAERVNAMAKEIAATQSGVRYVPSWNVLAGPHGSFVQYKRLHGRVQQIRYSDGVHLAPTGWDLLASALLQPMSRAWHINLHARPLFKQP